MNTFKFFDNDINKFILLSRKGVYPYEYMYEWEKFNETTLLEKEEFYSRSHACKKSVYLKYDTLILVDVFINFRKMCLKFYHLDSVKFRSAPGLAWQEALKKTGVKLELLNDIDILLMVERGFRGGICHAIHRYSKANNRYMKGYDKIKNHNILNIAM